MQRKTLTTLKELRNGDVFVFVKKDQVWKVTGHTDNKKQVTINQFINGNPIYKYDEMKSGTMQVVFLRHTVPMGGEECYAEDLQLGDVFHTVDNVVNEYEVLEKGNNLDVVQRIKPEATNTERIGKHAVVVFIRHKEAAHV